MSEPAVLTERDGHALIVTLNRPQRQNAINGEMLVRLYDALVEADEDPEIRVAILTGAGGNFCSGMDLKDMADGFSGDTGGIDVQGRLAADPDLHWKALLRHWKPNVPLIVAVEGTAIAGGTELLGATEIRVAAESAKIGIAEVRRALYPMGGSAVRIPRQIPWARAAELLLCGNTITAQEAYDLGLVNHVVPDGQALAKAKEIAATICANGPIAVKALLRTLRETNGMTEKEALDHEFTYGWDVFATEDAKEGAVAFKEKRDPVYKGR